MPISVVGHEAGHATAVDRWGGGGPLYGRFQCVRLSHTHLCWVAHALKMKCWVPRGLRAEVGPTILTVVYMGQLVLIPRVYFLMQYVVLLLILLWMQMLEVVLLLKISVVGRQMVQNSHTR